MFLVIRTVFSFCSFPHHIITHEWSELSCWNLCNFAVVHEEPWNLKSVGLVLGILLDVINILVASKFQNTLLHLFNDRLLLLTISTIIYILVSKDNQFNNVIHCLLASFPYKSIVVLFWFAFGYIWYH